MHFVCVARALALSETSATSFVGDERVEWSLDDLFNMSSGEKGVSMSTRERQCSFKFGTTHLLFAQSVIVFSKGERSKKIVAGFARRVLGKK